ncbi:MAG: S26 family signal peptidase, partial [Solirubrobacterales bacterium]
EVLDLGPRAVIVLAVVVVLTALYGAVPRAVAYGLTGGHTTLTISAMNVQEGDYLLVRRIGDEAASRLPRGTIVQFHPAIVNVHGDDIGHGDRAAIGQIAGLPGESIRIEDGRYVIDGRPQDPNGLPVPSWLRTHRLGSEILVLPRTYFVSMEYTVQGRPDDRMIRSACIARASDIRGRAFAIWWPLWRRGWIE